MSLEIDKKIMKSIILSVKDDFNENDYFMLEAFLQHLKESEDYTMAKTLWHLDGYKQILKQREYANGFCSRLLFEYHEPISEFEIFTEHCITIIHDIKYPCKTSPNICKALKGIGARAILITNEIICLIKNGFASGALARWRTLYEFSVIAVAIVKYGEETAKRYLAYNAVSNYNEAKTYNEHAGELGFEPITEEELSKLKKDAVKAKFEHPDLRDNQDYSWAIPHINKASFAELAKSTDINYLKPFYKFSCNYIHGSAKGLFYDLGQIYGLDEENSIKLARTNYGFTDPMQLTMMALLNIVSAIVSLKPDMSLLIQIVLLQDKLSEIAMACNKIEKEIEAREIKYRSSEE